MKYLELISTIIIDNKMISLIFLLFILLIIVLVLRKIKPSTTLQLLTHVFLYLIEILTVTKVITYFLGTSNNNSLLIIFKDYVFAYTLYQLLLLITFKLKDSLNIDAYTAIKTLIDKLQLYGEFEEKIPIEVLNSIKIEREKASIVFNTKQRNELNQIVELAEYYNCGKINKDKFRFALKEKSLSVDLKIKTYSYGWMNSILLRISK